MSERQLPAHLEALVDPICEAIRQSADMPREIIAQAVRQGIAQGYDSYEYRAHEEALKRADDRLRRAHEGLTYRFD